jgi:glucosamine 6-phosphate synthetase-like amidotransferase/phosphosugar isomerase protein
MNNHPQIVGRTIGVHNGTISNDDRLFEEFGGRIERKARVDTEIIVQLIDYFTKDNFKVIEAIKTASGLLAGGYACAIQSAKRPYNLYLFRNHMPVNIRFYYEKGLLMFATRDTFMDKVEDFTSDRLGDCHSIDLLPNYGVTFDLWRKKMCKFKL